MAKLRGDTPYLISQTPQWLVLFKPGGWLTIPGREVEKAGSPASPILVKWARENYGDVWTVHRLDRETSGLVMFARTPEDHRTANLWFQKHQIKKAYDCLAVGRPKAPVFKIQEPIEGTSCVTQVEVKDSYQEGFLARVIPVSGKRHQIRIHLARQDHALWGDQKYGGPTQVIIKGQVLNITRVALHASRLQLPDGQVFGAEWPQDFELWAERLQADGYRL